MTPQDRSSNSRYVALLAQREIRWLLASSLMARLPRGLLPLALFLLVRDQYGSLRSAGIVMGAFALANAAATPVQGALVDRFGQPRILLPCGLAHAATLATVATEIGAEPPVEVIVLLACLAGITCPPVAACTRALWRDVILGGSEREAIYALDSTTNELVWSVGPLLVGALVAAGSAKAAVLFAAFVTIIGVSVYSILPETRRWHSRQHRHAWSSAMESSGLRVLLLSVVLVGVCWGGVSVGLPAIAVHDGNAVMSGILLATLSIGSILGGLAYGLRKWRLEMATRYRLLLIGILATTAPLVATGSSLALTTSFCLLAGAGWAPALSCQYALTGGLAPPGAATEAFAWVNSAFGVGISLGSFAAGAIASIGVGAPFALGCVMAGLAALVSFVRRAALRGS